MVNTNNRTEHLNGDLNYDEQVEYKNCTVSDLLNVVIDRFIPKLYEKYIELNVRYTSSYKGYNRSIPFYMHDRPKWIVDNMIEELAKIEAELNYAQIIKIQNNIQNNKDITSARRKYKCQVDTSQTCDVESLSGQASKKETYRVDFGSNNDLPFFSSKTGSLQAFSSRNRKWLSQLYRCITNVQNPFFYILNKELFQRMNDSLNTTGCTQLDIKDIKEHAINGNKKTQKI